MADLSIVEKAKLFFNTAISTPFFIFYAVVGVLLIAFMVIDIKKHRKFSKIIYIISAVFLFSFFVIKYFDIIIKIMDSFVEIILKALYFPNLGIYIVMILIANLTFIYNIIKKDNKGNRIVSSVITIVIDFIFIMIIGIISSEKIDITSEVKLYSDATVLTLLQISMALFASMYMLLLLIKIKHKFKKYDKNKENRISNKNTRFIKILDLSGNND